MRRRIASLVATLAMAPFIGGTVVFAQSSQTSESVWDGIYTAAQAASGGRVYMQHCVACHGSDLQGSGQAPALVGGQFVSDFDAQTLGDLFHIIRTTMPMNAPGALSPVMYANVLAYLLQANGFPAGKRALYDREPFLAAIAFQALNPHAGKEAPSSAVHVPPADLAALDAANKASGVLSATASDPRNAPNSQPDPYRAISNFFKLPQGRLMGSSSSVAVDSRGNIWIADRCGANSCANSTLAPIMEFDADGNFIKAFGADMFVFPHDMYIDSEDHIWVVDELAKNGKGADIIEFNESGKMLRTLGRPGVARMGRDTFSQPTAVVVAPDGDVFVTDGHTAGPGHAARVVRYSPHGKFLAQWGGMGIAAGKLDVPHCLAIDNEGRLYVGDRWNDRIQVFNESGKLLSILTQFGRPSGCYIDKHDILYVSDSESRPEYGYGYDPGWKRGIRVGSVHDGIVTAFIPDTMPNADKYATSGGEGIWADATGAIYGAEVQQRAVIKYVKR
jgi:hypothetical protein